VVDDVISDALGLAMQHHNGFLQDAQLPFDFTLSQRQILHLLISVLQRLLEHAVLLSKPLLLIFFALVGLLDHLNFLLERVEFGGELLRLFLLTAGLCLDTGDFRVDLHDLVVLLRDEVFDSLQGLITTLHLKDGLLPIVHQSLL